MYTAVVTGASSGIGLEISKYLVESGYIVYGIGRNFRYDYSHPDFIKKEFDLMNINKLSELEKQTEGDIKILINCAGLGYFAPHEQLSIKQLHEMTAVNLEVPIILSRLYMRRLKQNQGFIINISSITAKKSNTYGCAYGALKAGLASFGQSLFDENRKYGLKVCTVFPDIVKSDFYRNADFTNDDDRLTYLEPKEVANVVKFIIENDSPVTELVIRPQKHRIKKKFGGIK